MAQTSRIPVLLTVPLSVMRLAASIAPPYWLSERPLKVLLPSAGLEVLNNAIAFSPCRLFRLSQRQGITAGPPAGSGPKAESNQWLASHPSSIRHGGRSKDGAPTIQGL